jgi:xylulokinase
MKKHRLSLGLDLSTQSLTAAVLDIEARQMVTTISLNYLKDPRLNRFGIRETDYILPPRIDGEADQPPEMFFAAIDAMFEELKRNFDPSEIAVINASGQQHGHVYFNVKAPADFNVLHKEGAAESDLLTILNGCLAYARAPIWMTSSTTEEAASIREAVGGRENLIKITGSDAQLRFTGPVIRQVAMRYPKVYERTYVIQLLGNLIPTILTGNVRTPADYGNACGTALMNYKKHRWDRQCLAAVAAGLPGGTDILNKKLPEMVRPDAMVGKISRYFVEKYGLNPECCVAAGSGDNPQSKVMVTGDLLSLGTSLVNMAATDGETFDMTGAACAMYDGIGRPFMFGCRTNGALVWDNVRLYYGLKKDEYAPAERALVETTPGKNLVLWQPRDESFPASGSFELWREAGPALGLASDYAGVIESSLAAVYIHSRAFTGQSKEPLYITGGATGSRGIMRRIAAIWKRPVVPLEKTGAALGAATAGISALYKLEGKTFDIEDFTGKMMHKGEEILPTPQDIDAFHATGKYLDRFAAAEARLIIDHPL